MKKNNHVQHHSENVYLNQRIFSISSNEKNVCILCAGKYTIVFIIQEYVYENCGDK